MIGFRTATTAATNTTPTTAASPVCRTRPPTGRRRPTTPMRTKCRRPASLNPGKPRRISPRLTEPETPEPEVRVEAAVAVEVEVIAAAGMAPMIRPQSALVQVRAVLVLYRKIHRFFRCDPTVPVITLNNTFSI